MSINLQDIFQNTFVNEVQERTKKQSLHAQEEREISADKKARLKPFIDFLQMFVDAGVQVKHKDFYSSYKVNDTYAQPVPFEYYLGDSSFKWYPGISIFIEHPQIEIAIPNRPSDGVVVISLSSHNPDANIINQNFSTMEQGLKALGSFLSKCTIKIEKPHSITTKKTPATLDDATFFSAIPQTNKIGGKSVAQQNVDNLFGKDKEKDSN